MSAPGGCGNCEFAGQSAHAFAGETNLTLLEDGSIVYAAVNSRCGASFGKVGLSELETHYPEFLQRLADCEGPTEETVAVPRTWPLGSLGLRKEVTVQRCGATDAEEMTRIVSESQTMLGIHKLNLEEVHGH